MDRQFIRKNLPGPVTVIVRLKPEYEKKFSPLVINKDGGVGFRVVQNFDYVNKICKLCDFPILSTSANKSNVGIEEMSIEYVRSFFMGEEKKIDYLIDAGEYHGGVPSAVIDITKVPHQVIRMGEYKE